MKEIEYYVLLDSSGAAEPADADRAALVGVYEFEPGVNDALVAEDGDLQAQARRRDA